MSSLYLMRGRSCRALVARPGHIITKRYKFSGRIDANANRPRAAPTLLPNTPARTRFAPSPTGYLHIGSLRTALYNFLLARATGGQFILRIEDTDQRRIVPDAETRLYEDLKWAGLSWNEGPDVGGFYGPYKQSERLSIYAEHASQLLGTGAAFRCFCTPTELDRVRAVKLQGGERPLYSGKCAHIPAGESDRRAANGEPHCVRFRSDRQAPVVNDLVYGTYRAPGDEDHFVIMKLDGYPTYHFANVVDDHLMEITHVIRGVEWLISTPRHAALYNAFGWQPPQFAHVGLLVDKLKQKLSKRHGGTDIASWRERGILPVTILNYVMLLGWSPGRGEKGLSEVMDLDDMTRKFHLRFTKGNITVNDKDDFLQQEHVRRLVKRSTEPDQFIDAFFPSIDRAIRMCEKSRLASPGGGGLVPRLHTRIGPLVPRAKLPSNKLEPDPDAGDPKVYTDYIRQIFRLDPESYKHGTEYLVRNKFLVWQVPHTLYAEVLQAMLNKYQDIFVAPVEKVQGRGSSLAVPEHVRSPRAVSELVHGLRKALERVEDHNWNVGSIKKHALPYTRTIFAVSKTGSQQAWGYPLLRWIMAASTPGPALTHFMAVLGRTETLRRVDEAYSVAKRVETEIRDMEEFNELLI